MTDQDLLERIAARLSAAGLAVPPSVVTGSATYVRLLSRWNSRMNLTSLPVSPVIPDSSIDKLLVEPLSAAALIPATASTWLDLGSGGGSPAIPLRLAHLAGTLTMVESRERKCAFLREVVRTLELPRTAVASSRFEEFAPPAAADVFTVRAVRLDDEMLTRISGWSQPGAILMCFGGVVEDSRYQPMTTRSLPDGSVLRVFTRTA